MDMNIVYQPSWWFRGNQTLDKNEEQAGCKTSLVNQVMCYTLGAGAKVWLSKPLRLSKLMFTYIWLGR